LEIGRIKMNEIVMKKRIVGHLEEGIMPFGANATSPSQSLVLTKSGIGKREKA
jgi:hypothetical protein